MGKLKKVVYSQIRSLREPFASASHFFGAGIGLIAIFLLIFSCNGSSQAIIASLVYGLALVTLFTMSALFHGLHRTEEEITRWERLDYAAIYIFIAGTYTPICLYLLSGSMGKWLLAGEWLLALIGAYHAIKHGPANRFLQVAIFISMGWAFVLALPTLLAVLSPLSFNLLVLGGVIYSLGGLIFAFNVDNILKSGFSAHDCWHVMVLLASAAHYTVIYQVMAV